MNEVLGRTVGDRIAADYVVMVVALVVWGAIFLYLMRLDRKVRELDKS
ncbi:MAG: CcmD family protein [Candidatus Eiseniibacteriota bacterium]